MIKIWYEVNSSDDRFEYNYPGDSIDDGFFSESLVRYHFEGIHDGRHDGNWPREFSVFLSETDTKATVEFEGDVEYEKTFYTWMKEDSPCH